MGASADHLASPFRYASARALCYCLVAQVSVLAAIDCSATPVLEVKNHFLVGNELRLIVETTVRHDAILPDAPSKTSDAKGWLISVELSSPGPLTERARVYGPLWDTPISHTGFGGLVFTEDDRKAALSTPFVAFDHEGKVVRISHTTSNGPLPRSMLDTTPVPAIWKQLTPFSPRPERIEPRSEESLQTPSHRYELRRGTDGKVTLYETLTGTPISNPWLTRAFATYREMKDMRNVTAWITEDLQYLVCFPAWIWNRSFEHLPIVTEFEWAGKSYSRKEYAFMLHEPNSDPIIFQRPSIAGSKRLWGEPQSVFVADGDLYFQYGTETNVVLWPFSSGRRYELQTSSLKGWDRFAGSRFQHMPNDGKIAFFIDDAPTTHRHPSENILVFLWDYRKDTVTRYETHIRELFRNHFGEYKPRKSTKPLEQ
jgi:hypothetical protein